MALIERKSIEETPGFNLEEWDKTIHPDGHTTYRSKEPAWYLKIKSARADVYACKGTLVLNQFRSLGSSYYAFRTNYRELTVRLEAYNDYRFLHESRLWAVEDRPKLYSFINEVVRLLHNYVASAKTLVDHTRIVVRRLYKGAEFYTEYSEKLAEVLAKDGLVQFIQHVRNHTLHQEMPKLVATFSLQRDKHGIMFNCEELKASWEGNRESLAFLMSLPDVVSILALVNQYQKKIDDFYGWLERRQQQVHRHDFEELDRLIAIANEVEEQVDRSNN